MKNEGNVTQFPAKSGGEITQLTPFDPGLYVALGPMGLVMGRLFDAMGTFITLGAPRVIQAEPTQSGVVSVTLHELLGKPEELTLSKTAWWRVQDPELRKLYLQKTTGLTLIH